MEKCSSEKGMDSIEAYTEEPLQEEGLFSAVRSILDRLAPDQTFQTLTHQITDLDIDTVEKSEGTIDLIFEKAINEAAFSGACAYMCRCLIRKSEAAEKNGVKGENMPFLKIVLNKCQKEFEKEESVEKRIHERLEELPSKGLSEEELQMKKNDLQDEAAILKRRTLGNIQFIGELFKLKILTENIVHDCIVKLLKRNDEEAFECLCKLLVSIGKYLDHAKAKPRVDQYFNQIKKIITARLTSARVRYMMQDIVDLRSNDWVPRREDNNPKTIDQIHTEEAADLAKKTQMMIQEADENKKLRAKDMKKGASEKGIDAMADYKQLRRTRNRWVRSSLTVKVGTEEEQKTEELFRKVRSILNKLTPEKFQTLTQQMIDLEMDTEERFEGAIDLIFEKAIYEPQFSVPYANMCRCLIPKKVFVEQDGVTKEITFRKILLNKLQREFEKEKSVEKRIHERLEGLSSKGLSEEELQIKKYDLQEEAALIKQRSLGNSRFIGELFKLKMLSENIMHDCVVKLLKSNDEEAFECLCTLLVTVGKTLDHRKAKRRVDQYFNQINKIITARITSARVRFLMQDVVDLRSNDWVPRREDNNPKTIDQIHKEAAKEAKFRR